MRILPFLCGFRVSAVEINISTLLNFHKTRIQHGGAAAFVLVGVSLLTNDTAISYRARPFEMAMVPYYRALNYIYLGQRSDALVEARRASQLQARFVDATLDGLREQDRSDFEQIRNNAFLLYYSGMLYDWDGELNDAFVAYRNAAVAYQQNHALLAVDIPPSLGRDLTRIAGRIGFRSELDHLHKTCPDVFAFGEDAAGLPADGIVLGDGSRLSLHSLPYLLEDETP